MHEGYKKYMRGRTRIALAMVVCLAIVALPTLAFATPGFSGESPAGTVNVQPGAVGVQYGNTSAPRAGTQSIKIDGLARATSFTSAGSVLGTWSSALTPITRWGRTIYVIQWTWTPGGSSGAWLTAYGPFGLANGSHNVTATVTDVANVVQTDTWVFNLQVAPVFGMPTPANGAVVTSQVPVISIPVTFNVASGTSVEATVNGVAATATYSGGNLVVTNFGTLPAFLDATVDVRASDGTNATTKSWSFNVQPFLNTINGASVLTNSDCTGCHEGWAASMGADCVSCHAAGKPQGAPHPATNVAWEFGNMASRHNVAGGGYTATALGMKTRFDGTQGGVLLKDSQENTVTTEWALPEVNVFWAANAIATGEAPATAIVGLNSNSVVSCSDCHSQIDAAGPHGGSAEWMIDSNYPAPYKYAVLGARKGTTEDTSTSGIKFDTTQELYGPVPGRTLTIDGATMGPLPLLQTYRNQGNFPAYIADGTKGEHAVICAKCHDLYNAGTGCDGWSNAYSEQSSSGVEPVLDENSPESVHGMHAGGTTVDTEVRLAQRGGNQGRTDGRGDCVSCHVAIPHGWKRPRLLVNGYTGPYELNSGEAQSVADPFPYWQGRGQFISEGNSPGNGPIDALEEHQLNTVNRVPVWSEQACISCSDGAYWESGGTEENGVEHGGFVDRPAKLK